ncbi:glycosyl transferase [Leifsonia sp. SIMBA_070]|uniref:glycosyl transferase n=1 Tax=Leifsonia sp. SIMBA_070 TaxID=3085810 RepID=UPI00397C6F1F
MTMRRLTVLQSFPEPRATTNPYIVMLAAAIREQPDAKLLTFSWRTALTHRYDVFHIHWPEILLEGRTPLRALARQLLTALLLLRIAVLRTPVVRTVHNLDLPEGINRRQRFLLERFARLTTLRITLNDRTTLPEGTEAVTIVHGHYRTWFADAPRRRPVAGRLAYFGLIRRYKNVQALVKAFRGLATDASLQVGGRPSAPELAAEIAELAAGDDRISLTFAFLTDDELVGIATAAELVVLPYREMHNSGGTLAALSLDRPVLIPDNEVNRALALEVGEDWVRRYSGELTTEVLREALTGVQERPPVGRPDLSAREWDAVGSEHISAYRRALQLARFRVGTTRPTQRRRYSW